MVDFVVDVIDGVGEWIEIFLLMFFRHEGVVLLLLETHLDRNTTSVKEGLPV